MAKWTWLWSGILLSLLLVSCQGNKAPGDTAVARAQTTGALVTPDTAAHLPTLAPTAGLPAATLSPPPTATAFPTPTLTPAPSATPTATPIGPCDGRMPDGDLLTIVTKTYGLSPSYAPDDLVPLGDYLNSDVTLGYPTLVRSVMIPSLVQMIQDMQAAGLSPQILSGYRAYSEQAAAYAKWAAEFPDRVDILSAPPGHSEHQLGTTIDFGSPHLSEYSGDPTLQFHTYFYKTPEGVWLGENAWKYGFILSYPREAQELTGFFYEPWHYRYVGREMAATLHEAGTYLTAYQLANQPGPCIP